MNWFFINWKSKKFKLRILLDFNPVLWEYSCAQNSIESRNLLFWSHGRNSFTWEDIRIGRYKLIPSRYIRFGYLFSYQFGCYEYVVTRVLRCWRHEDSSGNISRYPYQPWSHPFVQLIDLSHFSLVMLVCKNKMTLSLIKKQ